MSAVIVIISSLAHKGRSNTEMTICHCLKDIYGILLEIPMLHIALTLWRGKILWTLKSPGSLSVVWSVLATQHIKERTRNRCFPFFFFSKQVCRLPCTSAPPSLFYNLIYKGGLTAACCFGAEQILGEDLSVEFNEHNFLGLWVHISRCMLGSSTGSRDGWAGLWSDLRATPEHRKRLERKKSSLFPHP